MLRQRGIPVGRPLKESNGMDEMQGAEREGGPACLFHIVATNDASYGKNKKRRIVPAVLQRPPLCLDFILQKSRGGTHTPSSRS